MTTENGEAGIFLFRKSDVLDMLLSILAISDVD